MCNPPDTALGWKPSDWISYYGQCRDFQCMVAQKFITLITQASVYTTAVCGGMIALRPSITGKTALWVIASTAILPLLVFLRFLVAYYLQIRGAGNVMKEIEEHLQIPKSMALFRTLREKPYVFYGTWWVAALAWGYPALLALLLAVTAAVAARH